MPAETEACVGVAGPLPGSVGALACFYLTRSTGSTLLRALASLLGAIVWAVITVATKMRIGFMAVGVGFLVAWAVRRFGPVTQPINAVIGAVLALLGCVAGNLLPACSFLANSQGKAMLDIVGLVAAHPAVAVRLLQATFNEMGLLFYAIAV